MPEPLKPCPFCGHSVPDWEEGMNDVYCGNEDCPARMPLLLWNRRTAGPATRAMLDHLAKELAFVSLDFRDATIPAKAGYGLMTKIPTDDVQAFIDEWKPV